MSFAGQFLADRETNICSIALLTRHGGRGMDALVAAPARHDVIEFVAAFIRYAEESAGLVAQFLERWQKDLGWRKPLGFPRCFLWELAAILRIASWQQCAALSELTTEFLPSSVLFDDLLRRFWTDPQSMCQDITATTCPLGYQVLKIWLRHCSWFGMEELGADVVIQDQDIPQLLEVLVDFVWQHRGLAND